MTRFLGAAAAIAIVFASPVSGQTANPASPAPGNPAATPSETPQAAPGVPAPRQLNHSDRLFIREAAIGGMAETQAAKIAEQKASIDAVKESGRRLDKDHSAANDRLRDLAKTAGLSLPESLDTEHAAMIGQLKGANSAQFDRAYIASQIADHQKTAQLLEYEIGSGQDPQLKALVSDLLPVVLSHLRQAQTLASELSGQAIRSAR